jgi:hypothetical protein
LTRIASVGPSPKLRKRSKLLRIEAMLAPIVSSFSSLRLSSLPEGSPILVVPPPITTIGLCPACWSRRSSMIDTRLPTWSEGAVASKPI